MFSIFVDCEFNLFYFFLYCSWTNINIKGKRAVFQFWKKEKLWLLRSIFCSTKLKFPYLSLWIMYCMYLYRISLLMIMELWIRLFDLNLPNEIINNEFKSNKNKSFFSFNYFLCAKNYSLSFIRVWFYSF